MARQQKLYTAHVPLATKRLTPHSITSNILILGDTLWCQSGTPLYFSCRNIKEKEGIALQFYSIINQCAIYV